MWEDYKEAYEAQKKYDKFLEGFKVPDLKEGESYEIPVHGKGKKK